MCYCTVLESKRLRPMGFSFLTNLEEAADIEMKKVIRALKVLKIYNRLWNLRSLSEGEAFKLTNLLKPT